MVSPIHILVTSTHPVLAWRYIFDAEDRIAGYYTHDNGTNIDEYRQCLLNVTLIVVATLSGPGGAILRTFDIHTGAQLLEKQLHSPELGHHAEPDFFGKHVVFAGDNSTDIYILTRGDTFYRLDGKTGEIHWQFSMPDVRYALQ